MKTKIIFSTIIFYFSVSINSVTGQWLEKKINLAMEQYMALDQFSGAILVAKDGGTIYSAAFGEANKDFHIKNNIDTKFNIGSIGKTFTAIAILQLVERNKLELNTPVVQYLPDFPFGNQITIHHLLTHTAGTFNYFAHPDFFNKMSSIRGVSDALPLIYDQKLLFDTPGQKFSYSNSGIVLLGAIIEKVTGKKYDKFIQENIIQPAGMSNTSINYLEEIVENRSVGYQRNFSGKMTKNIFTVPPANADGGIETTVIDLLKFDKALYTDILLSEESKKKMFTPFLENYGYCTRIENKFGNLVVGHGGGAPGLSAQFRRYLNDKIVIIVLSNYNNAATKVYQTIENIYFGLEYEKPKISFTEFIYNIISSEGIDYTLTNIEKLIEDGKYKIRSDSDLNFLGYELIQENKINQAIAVFKINVKLFPDRANPYDSLGDAYLQIDDTKNAIKNFQLALEKDPKFESSKNKLDKLRKH